MSLNETVAEIIAWGFPTDASPGYFSLTLDNDIKMEATATRRAGLERFTFPPGSKPYFVLDLSNDLPRSFAGGQLNIDPQQGRITIGGKWGSRWIPFFLAAYASFRSINISLVLDLEEILIRLLRATISLMVANRSWANMESGSTISKRSPSFYPSNYLKMPFYKDYPWSDQPYWHRNWWPIWCFNFLCQ